MSQKIKNTYVYRFFRFVFLHTVRNPLYFTVYAVTFFLKDFSFNVSFLSPEEIAKAVQQGKSLIRMGDGEVYIMNYGSIGFQKYHPHIRKTLFSIIKNYKKTSPYILGINELVMDKTNLFLRRKNKLSLWLPMKVYYFLFFHKNISYFDASIFYYNDSFQNIIYDSIKDKKIIFVSREETLEQLKNNERFMLRDEATYVVTPDKNAFDVYERIKQEVMSAVTTVSGIKKPIVLASCGPAGKVLAYELSLVGIQVIDIGLGLEILYNDKRIDDILFSKNES